MDFPQIDVPLPQSMVMSEDLAEMEGLRGSKSDPSDVSQGIRIRAIRQEALRLGAQTGLSKRYNTIMEYMGSVEPKLNVVFSFSGFVREGRLLVPSIIEVDNRMSFEPETGKATEVQKAYTVDEEARVVTSIPTWRDYLFQVYSLPQPPHESLLPRNEEESAAWKAALRDGWTAGVYQADMVYQDRMNDLTKAVAGRHLYRTLEDKEMISPAALQVVANKVTFNGRTMNVGEIIYSVGNHANYLQADSWKPVWTR